MIPVHFINSEVTSSNQHVAPTENEGNNPFHSSQCHSTRH